MPQGRWAAAFVLPLVFAASFWRAQQEVYRSPRTRYEEPEAKVLVPYRFIATSVAQGIAAGLLVHAQGFLTACGFHAVVPRAL